ncbi:MAG TPA: hypothetical protein VF618_24420 [Thermoanaerobaculia bacterium]
MRFNGRLAARFATKCLVSWVCIELFFTLQGWTAQLAQGNRLPVAEFLMANLISAFLWALLTPLMVYVAERLPLHGRRALLHVVPLAAAIVAFVILRGAATSFVMGFPAHLLRRVIVHEAFARTALLVVCVVIFVNVRSAMHAAAESRRRQLELEASLDRARADQLRNRLDPALVLGALDAIAAAARTNLAESERMLHELCDRIRWSTSDEPEFAGVDE